MFSTNPKLSLEKFLVFGAVGLYVMKYINLKSQGELNGEPDLLVKIDKQKMFDLAQRQFKLNPAQRMMMEGIYDSLISQQARPHREKRK